MLLLQLAAAVLLEVYDLYDLVLSVNESSDGHAEAQDELGLLKLFILGAIQVDERLALQRAQAGTSEGWGSTVLAEVIFYFALHLNEVPQLEALSVSFS